MKPPRKMMREVRKCTACLFKVIQWKWFLPLTLLSGILYAILTARFLREAPTLKEALSYAFYCPANGNLLSLFAFYFAAFLSLVFTLLFLEQTLCAEYYIVRLSSIKILVFSKLLCILFLNLANLLLRTVLYTLFYAGLRGNGGLQPGAFVEVLLRLLVFYVTLGLLAFLLHTLTRSAISLFLVFSALFFFSLMPGGLRCAPLLFWLCGLNEQNMTAGAICGEVLLLILTVGALLLRRYDILPKEEEKNE